MELGLWSGLEELPHPLIREIINYPRRLSGSGPPKNGSLRPTPVGCWASVWGGWEEDGAAARAGHHSVDEGGGLGPRGGGRGEGGVGEGAGREGEGPRQVQGRAGEGRDGQG